MTTRDYDQERTEAAADAIGAIGRLVVASSMPILEEKIGKLGSRLDAQAETLISQSRRIDQARAYAELLAGVNDRALTEAEASIADLQDWFSEIRAELRTIRLELADALTIGRLATSVIKTLRADVDELQADFYAEEDEAGEENDDGEEPADQEPSKIDSGWGLGANGTLRLDSSPNTTTPLDLGSLQYSFTAKPKFVASPIDKKQLETLMEEMQTPFSRWLNSQVYASPYVPQNTVYGFDAGAANGDYSAAVKLTGFEPAAEPVNTYEPQTCPQRGKYCCPSCDPCCECGRSKGEE